MELRSARRRLADEAIGTDINLDEAVALAGHVRTMASKARILLEEQDTVWRGHIEATTAWLDAARHVEKEARGLKTLKTAEKWLKDEADALRNERLAPIADQAIANWELLKHESNVELRDITLRTVGRRREASSTCTPTGRRPTRSASCLRASCSPSR